MADGMFGNSQWTKKSTLRIHGERGIRADLKIKAHYSIRKFFESCNTDPSPSDINDESLNAYAKQKAPVKPAKTYSSKNTGHQNIGHSRRTGQPFYEAQLTAGRL